ncbi:MAG: NAD(P)H-dependent oxidoreductase subunit E [Deltaproteobacteria bacterium]|nr:NAD(P)H-dependent oxidoreductase subunit E [Deltaproteobacteria bacterium]
MDLKPLRAAPTEAERASIDAVVGPEESAEVVALKEARELRHLLLPALSAASRRVGFLSEGALAHISRRLHVPPAEVFGVASFYGLFSLDQRPPVVAHVCTDLTCRMKGAAELTQTLERELGEPGAPVERPSGPVSWLESPCLGLCERSPAALLTVAGEIPIERGFGPATAEAIIDALDSRQAPEAPRFEPADGEGWLLERAGRVDPRSLDEYRAAGGYTALRNALELGTAAVIREVTDSGLVGRGGAAFPTGRKWAAVAAAPRQPHHLVVNADESEPGTFKDRILMEADPFAVVEAATIAGVAVGASHGFIYVRGEYPLAIDRLEHAMKEARRRGYLGARIMGRELSFDLEIRRGAGAYVCGEETALFASIEGFRGEPRNKPPYPVEVGLFGEPTAVNNVETLVNVLVILTEGSARYRSQGTHASPGTKLFCLSGDVARPGLYEVPFGTTLRELMSRAGGATEPPKAVLLGGAAGVFVTASELDLELSFEATRRAGATLGSGVAIVFGQSRELIGPLLTIARFFRDESCGQCVPCRVGTARVEELLERTRDGRLLGSAQQEVETFAELAQAMRDASICGLGQTAPSALESAIGKLGVLRGDAR